MLNYLKNNLRVLGNVMLDFARKSRTLSNKGESAKKIIERINNDGYYILEDYYSKNHCDLLIKEIDNMIEVHGKKVWVDNFGSDHRLYGADRKSDFIVDFFQDRKLRNIAEGYMESHLVGFTLAARLNAKPENLGSGGGWRGMSPIPLAASMKSRVRCWAPSTTTRPSASTVTRSNRAKICGVGGVVYGVWGVGCGVVGRTYSIDHTTHKHAQLYQQTFVDMCCRCVLI